MAEVPCSFSILCYLVNSCHHCSGLVYAFLLMFCCFSKFFCFWFLNEISFLMLLCHVIKTSQYNSHVILHVWSLAQIPMLYEQDVGVCYFPENPQNKNKQTNKKSILLRSTTQIFVILGIRPLFPPSLTAKYPFFFTLMPIVTCWVLSLGVFLTLPSTVSHHYSSFGSFCLLWSVLYLDYKQMANLSTILYIAVMKAAKSLLSCNITY